MALPFDAPQMEVDKLLGVVYDLQRQIIERDRTIHSLNTASVKEAEEERKREALKKRFSVIDKRTVDTSSTGAVLKDALNHMLYALSDVYTGGAGILLLDVPYNANLGATNTDLRNHKVLSTFWAQHPSTPDELVSAALNIDLYHNIITQRHGRVFTDADVNQLRALFPQFFGHLRSFMAVPIQAERVTVAVVVMANGAYHQEDVTILGECLQELWTSSIVALVNLAMENVWKKESDASLSHETQVRDEIILSLDTILDEVVQHTLATTTQNKSVSSLLWKTILTRVANFFEEYFESEAIMAVTNSSANFKVQNVARLPSQIGSRQGSRQGSIDVSKLSFIYYIFSDTLKQAKSTKAAGGLSHPTLSDSKLIRNIMMSGKSFYTADTQEVAFPCGHVKVNSMLIVPIIFCDEPVGMLGLANGDFSVSSGRILQSVFTTFWSMIVKATLLSESQKVLNAALPLQISDRYKRGETIADSYPSATVLFADIVGFTEFTKELEPWEVVEYSNLIFEKLDGLIGMMKLELIKTIGDCYMVAGGVQDKSGEIPSEVTDRVVQSQMIEMLDFGTRILQETDSANSLTALQGCSQRVREGLEKRPLQFRIGIAEGTLTAGVFGTEKVQYDILGRTVNMASRLEGSSSPGKIHVCSSIRNELCERGFTFEKRDPITLKGLGTQQTYFYKGRATKSHPQTVLKTAQGHGTYGTWSPAAKAEEKA